MVKEITLKVNLLIAENITNNVNLKVRERIIKNNIQCLEWCVSNLEHALFAWTKFDSYTHTEQFITACNSGFREPDASGPSVCLHSHELTNT